ncbi:MAG: hypothetical protein K5884_03320 [Ruminococcus sp.]|nr:hypothetical protein [Ruminococcus sp.]
MVRYIRSNSDKSQPIVFHFVVDTYLYSSYAVAATKQYDKFNPVSNQDGSVNRKALADWELFVKRVALRLKPVFKTVHIEKSPPKDSLTSRYFWVYAKSEDGMVKVDFILRLRISDHLYPETHDADAEMTWVDDHAQLYKPDDKIGHQYAEIAEIVVQSEELGKGDGFFKTYSEAVKHIDTRIREIKKEHLDNQYHGDGEPHEDWGEDAEYELTEFTDKDIQTFTDSYRKSHGLE